MSEDKEQTPLPGAGPDLDKLVAAKMGYEWEPFESGSGPSGEWVIPGTNRTAYDVRWIHRTGLFQPQYSTNISAAWEIIEFITKTHFKTIFTLSYHPAYRNPYLFIFEIIKDDLSSQEFRGEANTTPLAICAAFLALPDFEVKE